MTRYTQLASDKKHYETDRLQEAIDRLAMYENMHETLIQNQTRIHTTLDQLRAADKTKTLKFREMFGQKVMNEMFLSLLKEKGIV